MTRGRGVGACFLIAAALLSGSSAQAAPAETDLRAEYDRLFPRVLAQPADVKTIIRFAELAVRLGDVEAAIGAYERLLAAKPNLLEAKIELGGLYLKVGELPAARTHLEAVLASKDLPEDLRVRAENYLRQVSGPAAPRPLQGFVQTGLRYQTNASPSGGVRLDSDGSLTSIFAQQPDWNAFGAAGLAFVHDFRNERGDAFEANLSGYYSRQFALHRFDVAAAEITAGPRFGIFGSSQTGASVKLYGIANGVMLGSRPYYSTLGAGVSGRYLGIPNTLVETAVEYRDRDFRNSTNYPVAAQQTGDLLIAGASVAAKASNAVSWVARGAFERNSAVTAFNSYERWSVDLGVPITFVVPVAGVPREWQFTPYGGYSESEYDAADPSVAPTIVRHDREWRAGAIFEAYFTDRLGLRLQVQYTDNTSSVTTYSLRNLAVSFGPTGRF